MFPKYAVAAASRRLVPRTDDPAGDVRRARPERTVPVGVRHAVRADPEARGTLARAVCGQDVTGWALFLELPFSGREPAECRRCAQLVLRDDPAPCRGAAPSSAGG